MYPQETQWCPHTHTHTPITVIWRLHTLCKTQRLFYSTVFILFGWADVTHFKLITILECPFLIRVHSHHKSYSHTQSKSGTCAHKHTHTPILSYTQPLDHKSFFTYSHHCTLFFSNTIPATQAHHHTVSNISLMCFKQRSGVFDKELYCLGENYRVCVCKVGNMCGLRDNGSLVAEKNYRVPFKVISVKLTLKHLCSITYTVNLSYTLSVTYYYLSLICRH